MNIDIIAAESLGVRGLCCLVTLPGRRIVIDPGVALGYVRHGLLPHPLQISVGHSVREKILQVLETATDVVFSHFHGDHVHGARTSHHNGGDEPQRVLFLAWLECRPRELNGARVIIGRCHIVSLLSCLRHLSQEDSFSDDSCLFFYLRSTRRS